MNRMRVTADKDGLISEVKGIGRQLQSLLNICGYSPRFVRAGYSTDRGFAIFICEPSSLPNIAFKNLQRPITSALIERRLGRAVVVDRDETKNVRFVVRLQVQPELMPEPVQLDR
jgi:hypothetical protein